MPKRKIKRKNVTKDYVKSLLRDFPSIDEIYVPEYIDSTIGKQDYDMFSWFFSSKNKLLRINYISVHSESDTVIMLTLDPKKVKMISVAKGSVEKELDLFKERLSLSPNSFVRSHEEKTTISEYVELRFLSESEI